MMQVPFDNLKEIKKLGDPGDPQISALNNEADDLFSDLCDEVKNEVQLKELQSAVERLKEKVTAREAAQETRKKKEVFSLGGEAVADYYLDKQMQAENKGKGNLQERMASRRKKFGPRPPESQVQ